jgi:hypothetical protein
LVRKYSVVCNEECHASAVEEKPLTQGSSREMECDVSPDEKDVNVDQDF